MPSTKTSLPEPLAGKYIGTFAHKVLTINLPRILDNVINAMQTHLTEIPHRLGIKPEDVPWATEEMLILEQRITDLKQEMLDNVPFREVTSNLHDTAVWNEVLERERAAAGSKEAVTWLNVKWLYAECYLYARMREIFVQSVYFKNFYPFYSFKEEAFFSSKQFATNLAIHLLSVQERLARGVATRDLFYFYVMTSLWGNQCDLSLSCGEQYSEIHCDFASMESKIMVNNFEQLWSYVKALSTDQTRNYKIDLILDNASYELFTDLCMVEFLHQSNLLPKERTKVHFHVKSMPWFVSDAMKKDFNWLLNVIEQSPQFPVELKRVDAYFKHNVDSGVWVIDEEEFWTLPFDYGQMPQYGAQLYAKLCKSDLIIFKGDLNYRKLVGDLQWPPTASFREALRAFQPTTAVCSLRTVKADVLVGVEGEDALRTIESFPDKKWMETGEYAVIHFLDNSLGN